MTTPDTAVYAPAPGTLLPNGAVVIAATANSQEGVILACVINAYQPYATWLFRDGDLRSTCVGHYFSNLDTALADYKYRVG